MKGNLTFNKCSAEDIDQVSELANRIWPVAYADLLTTSQIEYMLNWMYSLDKLKEEFHKGHLFYITKLDSEEVGFVGLEPNFPKSDCLRIHKIYLHPNFHGKKIGKWMMEKVEGVASELKMQYLHLNVNRQNAAVEFYLKSGFETIETEDIDIGNGFYMNDFMMSKKLTSAT